MTPTFRLTVERTKQLNVAIVGCGLVTKSKHIPAFRHLRKQARIAALCDRDEKLAVHTAELFHVPRTYASLTQLLANENIDIVDICVPPQAHSSLALEALDHGCHVIMEKPMALSVQDCDEIIARSKTVGRSVCVVHNDLFHPPMVKARELTARKAIGDFVGMRILLSTPKEEMLNQKGHWYHRLPGGMLGETGPHIAYMTAAFIGRVRRATVVAKSLTKRTWAPFDEFSIQLEGEGANCSAIVLYACDNRAAVVELFGTEAMLKVDLERMLLLRDDLRTLKYSEIGKSSLRLVGETMLGLTANAAAVALGRARIGTDIVIERFVESLLAGTSLPVTAEEGREAVRIMELVVHELRNAYPEAFQKLEAT